MTLNYCAPEITTCVVNRLKCDVRPELEGVKDPHRPCARYGITQGLVARVDV